jgi:hypothetical protein
MAAGVYSAGVAFLQVVPSFRGVEEIFRAEAQKLGRQFDNAIAKALPEGMAKGSAAAREQGAKAGDDFAGSFATTMRRRLDAAFRALPKVNIDGDTSKVDQAIAKVRRELAELRDAKIGVDIDDKTAAAALDNLSRKLRELEHQAPDLSDFINLRAAREQVDALRELVLEARRRGFEAGSSFGGAFADQARTRIEASLKALPEVNLDADPSDAERAIDRIRVALESLRGHVGIDLDDAGTLAQVEELKRQLDELAAKSPSVQVRVDAAAAAAELAAVLELANRVDASDPAVRVRGEGTQSFIQELSELADAAGTSGSRLAILISIGASIGTALVPAAAAAAVAVGAIGTAASAAVAGVGVAVLGFSGVTGAVQALNKYQQDTAKSAASLATSQNSVEGALDAVSSAERSLANTRESVASAARRAAQTVVDAQKSVVDAQKSARQAQEDLTRAYKDARQAQEDQALSMRSLELQQRQANLDVAEARKNLDAVLANPRATEAEREQARITYEQRVLQLDDLAVKAKRAQEDKAAADKAGIEGSTQVRAAQEKVQQATENIGKAQQHLAEAVQAQKDQQRQGAFQIVAAQQAVANAARQVEQANVRAGVAGGAALQNLRTAMDQLSPAGRRFAEFLFGLKSDFLALRNAAQGGLLPGVQRGVEALLPALGRLEAFVGRVGLAIGNTFADAVQQLRGPTWRRFFEFIDNSAVPALRGMAEFTMNTARGLAALLVALSPFNRQIGGGLINLSERFAKWAEQLSTSTGYRKFLAYVAENGPRVVDLLGQVAKFVERLVIAAAPVGVVVLSAFDKLLDILNGIPLPLLSAFVAGIAAFATAALAASAAARGVKTALATWDILKLIGSRFAGLINPVIQRFTANTQEAAETTRTFGFGLQQTEAAAASAARQFVFFQGLAGRLGEAGRAGLDRFTAALSTVTGQVGGLARTTDLASATMTRIGALPAQMMDRYRQAVTAATGQVGLFARAHEVASAVVQRVVALPAEVMDRYRQAVTTATGQVGLLARAQEIAQRTLGAGGDFGESVMQRFGVAAGGAAKIADRWTAAVGTGMRDAAQAVGRGVSGLVSTLGGPWGIAIEAATVAIGYFVAQSAAARARVDGLKSGLLGLGDAFTESDEAGRDFLKNQIQSDSNFRRMIKNSQDLGLGLNTITQAAHGNKQALAEVDNVYGTNIDTLTRYNEILKANNINDPDYIAAVLANAEAHKVYGKTLGELIKQRREEKGAVDGAAAGYKELRVALGLADDASVNMANNFPEVQRALTDSKASVEDFSTALRVVGKTAELDAGAKVGAYAAISGNLANSQLDASQKASLFGDVLKDIGSAADANGPTFDALAVTFGNIATSALNATDKADLLKKTLDLLYGAAVSQNEADERMARTQADLTNQLNLNSAGFDLNTAKTNADRDAVLQNRDALEAALLATRDKYVADIAAGVAEDQARVAHDNATAAILAQIPPTQRNSAAVAELNREYGEIPPAKRTDVSTPGLGKAIDDLITAHAVQIGLSQHPPWTRDQIASEAQYLQLVVEGRAGTNAAFKAEGGLVGGYSPHRRADNIPTWLTADEFVHPVDAVDYYGVRFMEALRLRKIPRELLTPQALTLLQRLRPRDDVYPGDGSSGVRLADGGLVRWPIDVPTDVVMPVSLADLWRQWEAARSGKWVGPVPKDVQGIQGWLRSIDGKPYVFGAVGPNAWDCSGLVGSVWALMRGLNPFVRYFSTHNEGQFFTVPGWGVLTAAWTNPGERGPGGSGVGHTRADLAGLGLEATGTHVRVGHGLTPMESFAHLATTTGQGGAPRALASGGLVKPGAQRWRPKLYDSGGSVAAGWNPPFYNGWSKPEALLNPQQWDDIRQAAARPDQAGNTYHFGFRDTTLTASKLQAMQAADAVYARTGRAR